MIACINSVPGHIGFIDAIVLVSILSQTRIVDLHVQDLYIDFEWHSNCEEMIGWSCEIDDLNDDGRITILIIDRNGL